MNNNEIQENDDDDMPELVSADDDNEDNHESIPSDDTSFMELYDEIFNEVLENAISEYLNTIMLSNRYLTTNQLILSNNRTYEQILQESFETQPEIEKTDHIVETESYKYSEIKDKIDDKDCCICLSEFEDDCEVSILMCNHILHKDCMIEWGKYKQSCPVCREEV
jgi:hypothetical protein